MAYTFTDGMDCYAALADMILGYWDSGSVAGSIQAGRFTGSRAVRFTNASNTIAAVQKSSGQNDPVHHIHVAIQQGAALTGTNVGHWITLSDGATAQCSIVFRSDGTILLTSGASNGATLTTYASAITATATWYSFEFEVVVNNTTGSFKVRKNGNVTEDFTATGLNTRGGTVNNYANRLGMGSAVSQLHDVDDFVWKSGAAAGTWIGEVRCRTRYMNGDSGSPMWTRSGTGAALAQSIITTNTTTGCAAGVARVTGPITVNYTGTIASLSVGLTTPAGNVKVAAWADNGAGTAPTTILGQSAGQAAISGTNVCAMVTPFAVTAGQRIWVAANFDAPSTMRFDAVSAGTLVMNVAYASFPQASPTMSGSGANLGGTLTWSAATGNYQMISERQQDGASSYNYSSNVNDIDRFTIEAIDVTPASTFATTLRGLLQKSDAGTRNTQLLLKSGATEVNTGSAALGAAVWGWQYRTDETDPATSAAWTATAVNNVLPGVQTTA